MKDPTRLRDAKSPHARAARDLLRSASGGSPSGSGFTLRGLAGPTLDQSDAIWARLAATVGPMPPGGGGGSHGGGDGTGGGVGPDAAGVASAGTATGGGGAIAASGGAGTGIATTVASTVHVASATSSAAKIAAVTAAAPAGKAALSLTAAKLWIAMGIGVAGSVGTAAYVASPGEVRDSHDVTAIADGSKPAPVSLQSRPVLQPIETAVESPAIAVAAEPTPEPAAPVAALPTPSAAPVASAPPTIAANARSSRAAVPAAPPVERASVDPAPTPSHDPPVSTALTPAERASRLRDEAKATADARVALRSGDAAGALRLLADAARSFGGGGMGQEREALTIEALARSGAREAAGARAAAFLVRWPASAYAATVRPFASESNPR